MTESMIFFLKLSNYLFEIDRLERLKEFYIKFHSSIFEQFKNSCIDYCMNINTYDVMNEHNNLQKHMLNLRSEHIKYRHMICDIMSKVYTCENKIRELGLEYNLTIEEDIEIDGENRIYGFRLTKHDMNKRDYIMLGETGYIDIYITKEMRDNHPDGYRLF